MLYQEEREYANLAYSIICLWLEGNVSSPVRYSYLSILSDNNADIFAASLSISYCSCSSYQELSWLVFMFFLKDSFWSVKDYLMQE